MSRYKIMFNKLHSLKEYCFVPFITISDPCIPVFYNIIDVLVNCGADALELGIPFSDPLADGKIVQNANIRALSRKLSIKQYFIILKNIRDKYPLLPIGILVYANIIFNYGIKNFYKLCKKIDIDSVLIPDVPMEESKIFLKYSRLNNINYIFICPPNAKKDLIKKISIYGTGYIYLISRSGVTGLQNKFHYPNTNIIKKFKQYNSVPILQGFGISNISEIKISLSCGTSGVICGSKIIQLIEKYQFKKKFLLNKIKNLIIKLKNATRK